MKYDVVIIGGGPAGMGAALESSKNGAKTLIIERLDKLGGILNQCIHNGFGLHYFGEELTGPEYAKKFSDMVKEKKIDVLLNTFVSKIAPNYVMIINENGAQKISAKSIVLATGCREKTSANITLAGSRPAGVYTAGQVQRMVNVYGKLPGKTAVIVGSGDIGLIMARRLVMEGMNVKQVIEIAPKCSGLIRNQKQCLEDFNIPLLTSTTATRVSGQNRVLGIYTSKVDENYKIIPDTEEFVSCDCVVLAVGLIPETDLYKEKEFNPVTNSYYINEYYQTATPSIFACGNVLHINDLADNVTVESVFAGRYAARYALGEKMHGKMRHIIAGEDIRYTIPSIYHEDDRNLTINFRVKGHVINNDLCMKSNKNGVFFRKPLINISSSELQSVNVDKRKFRGDITIYIAPREAN